MKKILRNAVLSIVLACGINPLYAGAGHDHSHAGNGHSYESITKAEVESIAEKQLSALMNDQKIPKTWSKADILDAKKKQFKYSTEWLVRFYNTRVEDKAKQIMYIFVNLSGEVTGVNYTGK
ncbi:MAG: hypothetical protein ACI9TV_002129 [Sulfurimonas sp.]|jgi:hypothetical protein|uniref:DUF6488 family protein n=1 Tax=Sulfurimonas sp. TaxID=2022749 RepID=UPI0039E2FED5